MTPYDQKSGESIIESRVQSMVQSRVQSPGFVVSLSRECTGKCAQVENSGAFRYNNLYIPPVKEVCTRRHRTAVEVARPEANCWVRPDQFNFLLLGFAGGIFAL